MNAHDHRVRDPLQAVAELRRDLICTLQPSAGQAGYLIEDPLRCKFFRLGVAEFTFARFLDGRRTVAEALGSAAAALGARALDEGEALAVCRWLVENQLAHTPAVQTPQRAARSARRASGARLRLLANPLALRLPLGNPDALLDRCLPRLRWLFTWQAGLVWLAVCLSGGLQVWRRWPDFSERPAVILAPGNWLRLALVWLALKLVHESAHALACKRWGGSVRRAGLMFILFAPVAFVDVTACWRIRSKWLRIAIAGAGMYAELFCAGLAAWLWCATEPGTWHALAHDTVWLAGWTTLLVNANPLVRFDGYFMLSDWLGIANLAAAGRQALGSAAAKWLLGIDVPQPDWTPRTRRIVLAYAVGSLAWRTLLTVLIAAAAIGLGSYLGGLLVAAWLLGCVVIPATRQAMTFYRRHAHERLPRLRLLRSAAALGACALSAGLWLARPATVSAPAVVEFASLNIVRAQSAGFVRRVLVENGQWVACGVPLVELENHPLCAELAELRLQVDQSSLRQRVHEQNDERAQAQAERVERAALEQRLADLEQRVADLIVRAPAAGQVLRRDLANLPGQYLKAGDEIAALGRPDAKEFWLAVPQDDVDLYTAHLGQAVQLRLPSAGRLAGDCRLVEIEPRAGVELTHPALSARVGGPLPVAANPQPEKDSRRARQTFELLRPHFVAKVSVPADLASGLNSGQLATAEFRSADATIAGHWYQALRAWFERQVESARRG